ncbi:hypothetical protein, partial [Falsiroseomonas oryziterrae]|uniref:hypothetical protein n=1 Tax=Falsiroseomonas oryziterrae TaxID=2911368 RepID=UPI001F2BA2F0
DAPRPDGDDLGRHRLGAVADQEPLAECRRGPQPDDVEPVGGRDLQAPFGDGRRDAREERACRGGPINQGDRL